MTSPRNSLFTELQRRQVSRVTTMAASTSRPLEYLESLPGMTFNKLYQQPSTALAIFRRMLPDLDPLPTQDLELWVKAESKK
ncbi:hypothetical protein PENSUB_8563 [Penicillium subrubescens]|uniref:Uncharacterized protein n=1 Tax=Penicillium subrubescens TaxID=1316194 RepID=A0A1Q5TG23_9EURO|nr:hypothetical protein PENSUB_8563 [Penicillium subrubescens]